MSCLRLRAEGYEENKWLQPKFFWAKANRNLIFFKSGSSRPSQTATSGFKPEAIHKNSFLMIVWIVFIEQPRFVFFAVDSRDEILQPFVQSRFGTGDFFRLFGSILIFRLESFINIYERAFLILQKVFHAARNVQEKFSWGCAL